MKRERLERLAEVKKAETNVRERAEDDRNRERTREREEKKEQEMNEETAVEFQEGGVLQSKEQIKAEAVSEVVKALALMKAHPELLELVGD